MDLSWSDFTPDVYGFHLYTSTSATWSRYYSYYCEVGGRYHSYYCEVAKIFGFTVWDRAK